MFTANVDTTGKNAYHYLESSEAVFRFVPWDFNASFGQRWNTRRANYDSNMFHRNGIWKRMASNPDLRDEMRTRFRSAMAGAYAKTEIINLLDAFAAETEASSTRDWKLWEDAYKNYSRWSSREDFTTPQQEVDFIRDWISERMQYLDESLDELLLGNDD
ncbi:MAG: CotH kinase family protein [Deltaproteobacteria bacterium]|nr:CotH kinase family protein [Deltaproteobacteria bacterium]